MNPHQFLYRMHIRKCCVFDLSFFDTNETQLPPNKTHKIIITCLKLCSFIDRAEQDILGSIFT